MLFVFIGVYMVNLLLMEAVVLTIEIVVSLYCNGGVLLGITLTAYETVQNLNGHGNSHHRHCYTFAHFT
jgi:hypothetical protein